MRRLVHVALAAMLCAPCTPSRLHANQIGAFSTDCGTSRYKPAERSFQFVATCAGRALSPDGEVAIVQHAYTDDQPPVELQDGRGRLLATLPTLSDDMPFAVFWSPDSRWLAVNHHVGSFMDELQMFERADGRLSEQSALVAAAKRVVAKRYPCLDPAAIHPNIVRWAADSRHLILVTVSAPSACSGRSTRIAYPLWMIGDAVSGRIDPASVRVDRTEGAFHEPQDPRYRRR